MPKKLERCVEKVEKQSGVKSAWAICKAALGKHRRGQMTLPGAFMWMVMLFGLAVTTQLRSTMYSTAIIQVGNASTSATIISAIEPVLWIGAIMSFLIYVLPSRETGMGGF